METRKKIYLKDYQKPDFKIEKVFLEFNVQDTFVIVRNRAFFKKINLQTQDLFLDGTALTLMNVRLNGKPVSHDQTPEGLIVKSVPNEFELLIETQIDPFTNTSLEGMYLSDACLVTQCEAQGFRRITYFMDRPDVMTNYEVRIEADALKYPVLLSNGDRTEHQVLQKGRHSVTWKDPHAKPCYLFALVAGKLGVLKDQFTTQSGKRVALEIYSAPGTQEKCQHAMTSLKKSMRWDEERYGREYDLSTFMIVATDSFNAGAMENKGLNIFNSRLILVNPQTATDTDFYLVDAVVAHEYFHNWTGNRVTLRDWFHLSLKEGLTVFREQEYSMEMASPSVIRTESVKHLRDSQFSEDAGPNAHPIRPDSCYAVDNFFTPTIYEKGSEVIRMMQTMVGRPGFRKGMDLYFERHDGQAVTIEDFAKAISDANSQDWEQFKLWYSQAGTPLIHVEESYAHDKLTLSLTQKLLPGQKAFHIPLEIGLIDSSGSEIPLRLAKNTEGKTLLHLTKLHQSFEFSAATRPVLSLNRQFSAPVRFDWKRPEADLLHLLKFDSDAFNRNEAAQELYLSWMQECFAAASAKKSLQIKESILSAIHLILQDNRLDSASKALLLSLPEDAYFLQFLNQFRGEALLETRLFIEKAIATKFSTELTNIYKQYHGKDLTKTDSKTAGDRSLKNLCLSYLRHLPEGQTLVLEQFNTAKIMTDEVSALFMLIDIPAEKDRALTRFYNKWKHESLVINKWFTLQSSAHSTNLLEVVKRLCQHPDFVKTNPNKVYSLLWKFAENLGAFHSGNGENYRFYADWVLELDKINPQVATRLAGSFDPISKLEPDLKAKALTELQRLHGAGLSKNTFEIIDNQLK